jgi:hypothetical protein
MKTKQILFIVFLIIGTASFAQGVKKMNKNLKVFISENFNRKISITIQSTNNDNGGALGYFTNSLASKGFKTVSSTSISNQTEIEESKIKTESSNNKKTKISNTNYVKSKYLFTIQYMWFHQISPGAPSGEIQCKNFTGQIVDLNNDSEIIATFSYSGNFDMDAVAEAVVERLNTAKSVEDSSEEENETPKILQPDNSQTKTAAKTKEERLTELKRFYEKQLITKEEYEEQKKKILEEN